MAPGGRNRTIVCWAAWFAVDVRARSTLDGSCQCAGHSLLFRKANIDRRSQDCNRSTEYNSLYQDGVYRVIFNNTSFSSKMAIASLGNDTYHIAYPNVVIIPSYLVSLVNRI